MISSGPLRTLTQGRISYLAVSSIQRAIPFALLPLFVGYLTPTEYGQVSVLTASFTLGSMTFGLGQDVVAYRYFASKDSFGKAVLRSAAFIQVVGPILISVVVAGAAVIIQPHVGGTPPVAIGLSFLASGIYCTAWQYAAVEYRCLGNRRAFFSFSLLYTLSVGCVKVLLVIVAGWGVVGWSCSDVVGSILLMFLTRRILRDVVWSVGWRLVSQQIKHALSLGVPVACSQLARWFGGFSDRILIVILLNASDAGSYLLATQLVSIGGVFITELERFIQPRIGRRDVGIRRLVKDLLPLQFLLALVIALGTASVGIAVSWARFADEYSSVGLLTVGLSATLPLLALNYLAGDLLAVFLGKSRWLASVSVCGGICTAVLNLILIHWIGLAGAVIAAVVGQLIVALLLWAPIVRSVGRPLVAGEC